jgi:2-polyprenyl-3-methyl-5-hydroxy-6-metoxy-1,4-benzoquinol methylase
MARTHGNLQKHESSNPIQRKLIARFHRQVITLVEAVAPSSILEVGCGEGFVLGALADAGVPARLTGVDNSEAAIVLARRRLQGKAALHVEDARDLARDGSTYELVMMLEVLEHLEKPEDMLPVLGRLANKAVLLSVPHEPWFRVANMIRLKNVREWGNDPEHVNHWTRRSFGRFVATSLDVRQVVSVFPWTLVLASPSPPS